MNRCALVRSLGHTISAHGPGTTYMATGNRPGPALEYPAAGPLAAKLLPQRQGVPPYVTFAALREGVTGPGYLGPAFGPFEVEGDPVRGTLQSHGVSLPDGFTLNDLESREALRDRFDRGLRALERSEVSAGLDRFHRQAVEILHSDRVRSRARPLARARLAARRLRPDPAGPGCSGRPASDSGRGAVRDTGLRWLGHTRRQLPRPQHPPPARRWIRRSRPWYATSSRAGCSTTRSSSVPENSAGPAGQLRGRPRPLGAVDGRAAGRRRIPRRSRLRSDQRAGNGSLTRRLFARRPGRHHLPAPGIRPPPRSQLGQRPTNPNLPRGALPGSPRGLSVTLPLVEQVRHRPPNSVLHSLRRTRSRRTRDAASPQAPRRSLTRPHARLQTPHLRKELMPVDVPQWMHLRAMITSP